MNQDEQNKTGGKWVAELLKSKSQNQADTVPVKLDPRWEMRIFRGPEVQELIFENSASSRRLPPGSAELKDESSTKLGIDPADWRKQDADSLSKLLGQNP